MSALFQQINLTWNGDTHKIRPTMDLLNEIENHHSLSKVALQISKGEPRMTHVANIIAIMLRSDGVKVKSDEVYQAIMHGGEQSVQEAIIAVVTAASPNIPDGAKKG